MLKNLKNHKKKIIAFIVISSLSTYYAYESCIGNMYCRNFVSSIIPGGKHNSPQKDESEVIFLKKYPQYKHTSTIHSAHNSMKVLNFELPSTDRYGALATFEDTFIFMNAFGKLFIFKEHEDIKNSKLVEANSPKLKIYKEEFDTIHDNELLIQSFAVQGLAVFNKNKKNYIIASSFKFNKKSNCHTISLFKAEAFYKNKILKTTDWENIYNSSPCLKFRHGDKTVPGAVYNTVASGGKVHQYDDNSVLLTIGDLENNGVSSPDLVQDLSSSYGKIIKVNIFNKDNKIFSLGHRNPQGLYISNKKIVFETEHGPHGGDELNIIKEGKNYGWPLRTFGVNYDIKAHRWYHDKSDRTHSGYEKPIMSWIPSIAISNLIQIQSDHFNYWKNDLIVSSLKDTALFRLHLNNLKVITIERIHIGERIRDIIELKNGRIVLLTEDQKNWNNPKSFLILNYFKPKTKP